MRDVGELQIPVTGASLVEGGRLVAEGSNFVARVALSRGLGDMKKYDENREGMKDFINIGELGFEWID